jgi:DNA-binding SARP family transcriptional activator
MLRIHVLGGITICRDGVPLTGAATQPRRLAVLGLLARCGTRTTTRDKLIDLVWPDASEDQGRRALTQALYALRRELGGDDVFLGAQDLRLNPERVRVDLWDFERALAEDDPARAVEVYAGPFLDGFRLAGAGERWSGGARASGMRLRGATRRRWRRWPAAPRRRGTWKRPSRGGAAAPRGIRWRRASPCT